MSDHDVVAGGTAWGANVPIAVAPSKAYLSQSAIYFATPAAG